MLYLISYNLAKTTNRNKLINFMNQSGFRVSFSLYECHIKPDKFEEFLSMLKALISKDDKIRIYPVCSGCKEKAIGNVLDENSVKNKNFVVV